MDPSETSNEMTGGRARTSFFLAALAVALAVAAYANSFHGPFTFDDQTEVVDNPSIEDLSQPLTILRAYPTRPLVNLSYALDYALWGGRDVVGFHITNVVLHVANVLLLFVLVRRLARTAEGTKHSPVPVADATAFLAAGLFAVHPALTEAVSYVSGRAELLVTGFFLSSIYGLHRGFSGQRSWLAVGAACFFLALSSKETAAVLPVVLLALDVLLFSPGDRRTRLLWIHGPLFTVVIAGGLVRTWIYLTVEHAGAGGFAWARLGLQAHVAIRYISLLLFPHGQTIVPPVYTLTSIRDPRLVVAILVLGGIALAAVVLRNRLPIVTFGLIWFALALLPSSVLVVLAPIGQPMAEHRVYLASCGFFMALAAVVVRLIRSSAATARVRFAPAATITGIVFVALLLLTAARNRVWSNPVQLWAEAVERSPDAVVSYLGLAHVYRNAGDCDAAEATYNRAITLRPTQPEAYLGLVGCFVERNRLEEAAATLRLAGLRMPNDVSVRLALAGFEERAFGNFSESVRLCREVLAIQPDSTRAQDCIQRLTGK